MATVKKAQNLKGRYMVEAVYIGESIDLKKLQENVKQYSYMNRDHPLVIKLLASQYAVITKFGVVAFWNVSEKFRKEIIQELIPFTRSKKDAYSYSEKIRVLTGMPVDKVLFNRINLQEFSIEKAKIISYVLSQSVALDRYEHEIEKSLNDLGVVIDNLKNEGRVLLGERQLLKQIGDTFSVKQTAVAHLSLFDKPDEVWESEDLERLYNRLSYEMELQDRFDVLDEKMDFLSENAKMLMDFAGQKRANFLELIVVLLIVIEIIIFVIDIWPNLVKPFIK